MAHIAFPEHYKTFTTPSSCTKYTYVYCQSRSSKPTMLFLHGFPSSSYDWRHQITYFSSSGYGVLVPDLLGYGGTDKPSSLDAYRGKKMAQEVIEIMDHEQISNFHCVAHDFGTHLLSRLSFYFPSKLLSCTFIAVPYLPPGTHTDLDFMKAMTEKTLGFERFGYIRFMASDDSGDILDTHNESFSSLIYTSDRGERMNFFLPGALHTWITAERRAAPSSYISSTEMEMHNRILATGGYRGPTNWYRALVGNLSKEEEKAALESGSIDAQIVCPVLTIDAAPDGKTSVPDSLKNSLAPFAKNLKSEIVATDGHWVQIESHEQVNAMLEGFFESTT